MNIAIVGTRSFENYELLIQSILTEVDVWEIGMIVSGGARGADTLAEKFAAEYNIPTQIIIPDWKTHGKSAGFIRNSEIVKYSDILFAFWDRKSQGTADSISKAKKKGIPTKVVYYDSPI